MRSSLRPGWSAALLPLLLASLAVGCVMPQSLPVQHDTPLPATAPSSPTAHMTRAASPFPTIPTPVPSLTPTISPSPTTTPLPDATVTPSPSLTATPQPTAQTPVTDTPVANTPTHLESPTPTASPTPQRVTRIVRIEGLGDEAAACTTLTFYQRDRVVASVALIEAQREGEGWVIRVPKVDADRLQILGSPDGRCPWQFGSFAGIDPDDVPIEGDELVLRFLPRPPAQEPEDPCDGVVGPPGDPIVPPD